MHQQQHRLSINGAELVASVIGTGCPVVFLHAAVCDSRMWQQQLPVIGTQYQGIAYDRRGHGSSRAAPQDHSAVADLLAVLDTLTVGQPAVLVACSQGGRIALDAAVLHPQRFRGLCLISPSLAGAPEPVHEPAIAAALAQQQAAQASGDPDALNAVKARLWLDGPLQPEGRVGGTTRALFLEMNGDVLRAAPSGTNTDAVATHARLAEINCPALVLCGDYDFPYIQARCRHMAETMPEAVFEALPGMAHLPSLEQPEAITSRLLAFLQRIDAAC